MDSSLQTKYEIFELLTEFSLAKKYIIWKKSRITNKNFRSIDYCENNSHGSNLHASFYDEWKNER